MEKTNSDLRQIVFYGFDFSSIDKAYVTIRAANNSVVQESLRNSEFLKGLLWAFLQDVNEERNELVISHSEHSSKEVGTKDDYKLSDKSQKPKDNEDPRQFGNLVGTIRKIYNKTDRNTCVIEYINDADNDDIDAYPLMKQLSSSSKSKKSVSIKVQVFSRFDRFDVDKPESTAPNFLAAMLLKGNLKFNSKFGVSFNYDSLFDFYMLWVLMNHFKEAVVKGFFKKYQRFERNDDRLKGTIDVSRHIKLNMGSNNGKIAYSYRENTIDNYFNHLFLAAIDYLNEKYPDLVYMNINGEYERIIKQIRYDIGYPKYDRRFIISKNNQPISHPYFSEYKDLQKDCLSILRDEGVSPFGNEDEQIDGVLYYVPDLWEDYNEYHIKKKMRNYNRDSDFETQIMMSPQIDIKTMTNLNGEDGHITFPDYVFNYNLEDVDERIVFFMLDAKYRPQWKNSLSGNLDSNLLGDYDKCIRDMVSVGAISSGVIFPMTESDSDKLSENIQFIHRFSKYNNFNYFYTVPVVVPAYGAEDSYQQWEKKLADSVNRTLDILMPALCYEAERHMLIRKHQNSIVRKYDVKSLVPELLDAWSVE
ncbi:MAG: hypothetical protein ILA15_02440 [Clostridiales bacterium]|nr:hypothetical protein [Clostridiales bacterium]